MPETIKDGGPAFPDPVAITPAGDAYPSNSSGMSLRDWFAGQALTGLLAQSNGSALTSEAAIGARWSYEMADAMLAAREAR